MVKLITSARQNKWLNIFVIYVRYLIGAAFVFSSIPKIAGKRFTTANGEYEPIHSWIHFFETLYRSGIYWQFLGWVQLLAGFFLMTQRFATLAAIIFFPIIINIYFITISLDFHGTPIITGLMLMANVFLLLWDYNKLFFLLRADSTDDILIKSQFNAFFNHIFWAYLGILFFVTTLLYVIYFNRSPLLWLLICTAEGFAGLIYFITHFKRKKCLP
jgi:hypothetical protein